jgi:GAF domain-containing protein
MSLTTQSAPAQPERIADVLDLVRAALDVPVTMASHIEGSDYTLIGASDDLGAGLEAGGEFETSETFCQCVYDDGEIESIPDIGADERVAGLPAHETIGLESYLGVPLHRDGSFYGTLVASDTTPREFTDTEIEQAHAAAGLVETLL